MRIVNLASGSTGNLTYLESESTKILIDIGLSCKEVEKRIALLGITGADINAILITHEHTDHVKGLDMFASKFKTKVYAHKDGWDAINGRLQRVSFSQQYVFSNEEFQIGDITVCAFKVPHDAKCCVGYYFKKDEKKISILTDFGQTNEDIIKSIGNSQLVYLESNHDIGMLGRNPNYSASLKRRILSPCGHLSNLACAELCVKLAKSGTRQIVLSHLSQENNTPALAFETVKKKLQEHGIIEGVHIKIDVASPFPGNIFKIK